MTTALPRLVPGGIVRERISAWLARNVDVPLRLLAAPTGAGKTSAISGYLPQAARPVVYLALNPETTPDQLRARLAGAFEASAIPQSLDELLPILAAAAPREIALDDIDRATTEARDELTALVAMAPPGISFIFAARSCAAFGARRLLARGLAVALDASALAFDAADVTALCTKLGVAHSPAPVARLLEETEGWPIVASWAIRECAETKQPLEGAYDRWRRDHRRDFAEFLDEELRAAGEYYRAAFRTLVAGNEPGERARLAALEARGLFVHARGDDYVAYRVARQLEVESIPAGGTVAPQPASLLVVRMLGRFEIDIEGRRIEWIRRREAQIFKYLLLKPGGSATRAELRDVFWPDAEPQLATQSLRTASSNIRKAIAAVVGYGDVDRYFSSRGDIAVNLENAVIDVRRFTAHIADGDAALDRNRTQEAFAHYRAAESLYSGELLSGEYPEPWYAPRAEMYKSLYLGVLERLAEHHADAGHARQARDYAQRARELRPSLRLVPEVGADAG